MPSLKIHNITIYYEIHGDGFPLVMIMGLSGNIDWWTPELIEPALQDFKVVIFDNRGAGQTDQPKMDYSIKMFADDTAALMDALGIERAHILGVSMGGMIAQELVLNSPEKVEKLVLGCTTCGGFKQVLPSQEVLEVLTSSTENMTREEIIELIIPLLYTKEFIDNNPEFIESYKKRLRKNPITAGSFKRQVGAILGFNSYKRLKNINVPTFIIHGKEDRLIPPGNAEVLAGQIPGAKVLLLDNAAHSFFRPDQDKVLNAILDFLKTPAQ